MGRHRQRRRDGCPPKQVNPLKAQFDDCIADLSPMWVKESFLNISKPFIIDIGCGEGEWCVKAATDFPDYNFLGVEIRVEAIELGARSVIVDGKPDIIINHIPRCYNEGFSERCLDSTSSIVREKHKTNVGFVHANVLAGDLHRLCVDLRSLKCRISVMAIQYPDPHWKTKHQKKRMWNQTLYSTAAAFLHVGNEECVTVEEKESVCVASVSDVNDAASNDGVHIHQDGVLYVQSDVSSVVDGVRSDLMMTMDDTEGVCMSADCRDGMYGYGLDVLQGCDESVGTDECMEGTDPVLAVSNKESANSVISCVHDDTGLVAARSVIGLKEVCRGSGVPSLLPACFHHTLTERAMYVTHKLQKPTYHGAWVCDEVTKQRHKMLEELHEQQLVK